MLCLVSRPLSCLVHLSWARRLLGQRTTVGSGGGVVCEEDGYDLAQAVNESNTGGLYCSFGPIAKPPALALALGCSRLTVSLQPAVKPPTLLPELLFPRQLIAICPPCLHAKHLMLNLHASLRWPSDKRREQKPGC